MTTPEDRNRTHEIPDEELGLEATARARSERILGQFGKKDEATGRLTYSWKAGWVWHKKFTLSREDEPMVDAGTVYVLEYESLIDIRDKGHYDYSENDGLLESTEIADRDTKEYFGAQLSGQSPSEIHQNDLLDCLSSLEKIMNDGPGF